METDFVIVTSLNFIWCCKKVLIPMNTWMIGKSLMKHHYLKKKLYDNLIWKTLWNGCALQTCKKSLERF